MMTIIDTTGRHYRYSLTCVRNRIATKWRHYDMETGDCDIGTVSDHGVISGQRHLQHLKYSPNKNIADETIIKMS